MTERDVYVSNVDEDDDDGDDTGIKDNHDDEEEERVNLLFPITQLLNYISNHPRRRNVTTLMVGLKNGHMRKNLTQNW